MESNFSSAPTQAHPETMDFLSRAWCDFAVQAFQPPSHDPHNQSIVLLDPPIEKLEKEMSSPDNFLNLQRMDNSVTMDDAAFKSLPPWKSNDVKSWIWMQQAMHPELNYNSCFRKKWAPWKMMSFKIISIKKWLKEMKLKRKEEERLQRTEVHAAISVAGVAAALAAIAAESSKSGEPLSLGSEKEAAVASAAALVAAQCAQVAEAMGAKREQLSNVIRSATSSTSAGDILTLTAAATTSLRGAATLKARTGCRNRLKGTSPVLPIDQDQNDFDFDFDKGRSVLAKGAELSIETPDGRYVARTVSLFLNNEAKVILQLRKLNLLKSKQESIVLDLHAELYKDGEAGETETCYLIVLTTSRGTIKLDMVDDYRRYKLWTTTINHLLILSASFSNYELQFYRK
ncbi:VAN3-binding protein isoform X1 [Eucalyptus grandis]|uniref:VAN3-binding protein isoform X1 n=1 Tax=Eucalyptus grandis TaxID=71139 RepID=UPI00052594EC|nr:VAN3-binding protein isoform X1 [Eucalyptus grandis]